MYWRHNFYNIIFKIKPILYIAAGSATSPPPPPMKNSECAPAQVHSPFSSHSAYWRWYEVYGRFAVALLIMLNMRVFVYDIHLITYLFIYLFLALLTYLLIYLPTPCSRVLLEKLTVSQLVKKFPAFYGTRSFITAFTISNPSLSWATLLHDPTSHFLKIHLNIIIPSTVFQVVSFPQVSPPKPCLCTTRVTWPACLIRLDLITRKISVEQYTSLSSSLYSFLHSPVTSSFLNPNILLSTPFQAPSAYVPSSIWATKFHTHTIEEKNS